MRTVIYGASDDLIEVEGDNIREEFNVNCDQAVYVGLSNGNCLRVTYDGIWNIRVDNEDPNISIVFARSEDDNSYDEDGCPGYSDKAVIEGDVEWVVVGKKA